MFVFWIDFGKGCVCILGWFLWWVMFVFRMVFELGLSLHVGLALVVLCLYVGLVLVQLRLYFG